MAKIHPNSNSTTSSSSCTTSNCKETFTIWMKSLVFNGNGCTVYDSHGEIVYRMDNYDTNHSNQVHLMDLKGNLIFTILKKKLSIFRCWEAYRYSGSNLEEGKPWFRVKKAMLKRDEASIMNALTPVYRIQGCSSGKVACKIVNQAGELVAEVMRKQSASGIVLGEDVLKLVIEPNVDHSLAMAFVIVYNLMNRRM
ncbi:hypothetical protein ACHQM5_029630 [Ranunculus cassubicifolius]